MTKRDAFDQKASAIVDDHIRSHNLTIIPFPDRLKDAIAQELRLTWNDAIDAATTKALSLVRRHSR